MYELEKAFEYENGFMLTSGVDRISKFVSRVEFYNKIKNLPGEIVECGVFKGSSLSQFIKLRSLFGNAYSQKIFAFDTFDTFPKKCSDDDKIYLKKFLDVAGDKSIKKSILIKLLKDLKLYENLDLIKGNILDTVPKFVKSNKNLKISLLHVDVDTYQPTKIALENFFPLVVKKGIIILDDYGAFPGANKAIDEFIKGKDLVIKKLSYSHSISYIEKK